MTIKSIAPDGTEFESITDIADGDDISNQGLDIYYTITPSKYTAVADNRMYWAVKTVSYQYGDNPSTTLPWGNIDSCYNTYKGGIVTITYERALNVAFDGFDEIGLTPSQTTISESTLTTLSTQVSDSSYVAGTIWNELEIWSSIDFDKYCLSIKYCNPQMQMIDYGSNIYSETGLINSLREADGKNGAIYDMVLSSYNLTYGLGDYEQYSNNTIYIYLQNNK